MSSGTKEENLLEVSKARGCLLGGAGGDALGSAVEFMSREQILRKFGREGITRYELSFGRRGSITDATQMTLFTAEGLLRAQVRFEIRGLGPIYCSVVSHAYLRWLKTQGIKPASDYAEDGWLFQVPRTPPQTFSWQNMSQRSNLSSRERTESS